MTDPSEAATRLSPSPARGTPRDAPSDRLGSMLGDYRIERLLGSGGVGSVFLAHDTKLHRHVALKLLDDLDEHTARERMLLEARSAAALNHPNVCTIYEAGEVAGRAFIAMEYVEGRSLADCLGDGDLGHDKALHYGIQAASALDYAHGRGVIHRDFKAANVIVTASGTLKVVDFGLARRRDAMTAATAMESLVPEGCVAGTPCSMAPEQVRGEATDARTDVWALGVLLHEMLAGKRPFQGKTTADLFTAILRDAPERLPARLPEALRAIVARCLEKEPARRYPGAGDVAAALQALGGVPVRPRGTQRRVLVLAGLAAAALGIFIALRTVPHSAAPAAVAAPQSTNREAQDLYLRALSHIGSYEREAVARSITLLEQSVTLDPGFAAAQALLAVRYGNMSSLHSPDDPQWEEKGFAAVQKALRLDPDAPEAHYARGVLLWRPSRGFPHREALEELRKALAARPDYAEAMQEHSQILLHVGHMDAALDESRRALAINPENSLLRFRMATIYSYQQRFDEAIAALDRLPPRTFSTQAAFHRAWAHISLGRIEEASQVLDELFTVSQADPGGVRHAARAMVKAKRGDRPGAEADIAAAIQAGSNFIHYHHAQYVIGAVYAQFGEFDRAQQWIEDAANNGFPNYTMFERDLHLERLRATPRFRDFLAKLRREWEHIPGEQ